MIYARYASSIEAVRKALRDPANEFVDHVVLDLSEVVPEEARPKDKDYENQDFYVRLANVLAECLQKDGVIDVVNLDYPRFSFVLFKSRVQSHQARRW